MCFGMCLSKFKKHHYLHPQGGRNLFLYYLQFIALSQITKKNIWDRWG